MFRSDFYKLSLSTLLVVTLTGCASQVWNQEIDAASHNPGPGGYEVAERLPQNNARDVFIVLAFSGGGGGGGRRRPHKP